MEKLITAERTGLRYELVGDYYLIAGGQTHRHFGTTTSAVYPQAQGQLVCCAADHRQAERLPCRPQRAGRSNFSRLVKQLSEKDDVTEALFFGKSNILGTENEQHP